MIKLGGSEARRTQAIRDRVPGKLAFVFAAGEAFLLGRGDNAAVHHQGRGGVVIEGGDAEDGGHRQRQSSGARGDRSDFRVVMEVPALTG